MEICFVMYGTSRTGGTRVLFEVGNRLAKKGHKITFVSLGTPKHEWFHFNKNVECIYPEYNIFNKITISQGLEYLFKKIKFPYLIDKIKILSEAIPDCDFNIATFCFTAYAVYRSGKGTPFYYIQHYEPLFFYLRQILLSYG